MTPNANLPTVTPRKGDTMTRDQMIMVLYKRTGRSAVTKLLSRKTGQGVGRGGSGEAGDEEARTLGRCRPSRGSELLPGSCNHHHHHHHQYYCRRCPSTSLPQKA
ncbi:uncharacterized protein DFL_001647 [Arthrobotrys flagrans]|uniref:Uncharacterized protein n=1 Tax=Arthrobotrys flagrans TaxID=97331 RepID=A0A437A8J1_ARTFL|nr:hypothetical protein DFL_001647 [Arthrobotrys flagrans]